MHRRFPTGVILEDHHCLAVNKPAGIATHTPDPSISWGWYDYFHWINPDAPRLKLLHRLDRDTSGVLLFAKTPEASRELSRQWESGSVFKRYVFATRQKPKKDTWRCDRAIDGQASATEFKLAGREGGFFRIEARPLTGRTHQVRIHAAASGVPVVGDREHGKSADDWPLLLHAAELRCTAPGHESGVVLTAPLPETFSAVSAAGAWWLRAGFLREAMTPECEAVRRVHGAADGFAGEVVEQYADRWLAMNFSENRPGGARPFLQGRSVVTKRYLGGGKVESEGSAEPCVVSENGLRYEVRFDEATTTGLFLDQRENRLHLSRLLPRLPDGPVLNCFAHTCSFSVVAASAGRPTASVDLSAKYLEWGKRNFALNGLDSEKHRWLRGDAADWIKRLKKKGEKFAAVILDPPSFSRAKQGDFSVDRDLETMVGEVVDLVPAGGALLVAANFQKWPQEAFLKRVSNALRGRKHESFCLPLPPDFPYQSGEKLWMKSVWITLGHP